MTLAKEFQELLYGFFQEKLFKLKGEVLQPSAQELPEEYIKKSELIEICINILNDFGESLDDDKRFNNEK